MLDESSGAGTRLIGQERVLRQLLNDDRVMRHPWLDPAWIREQFLAS